MKSFKINTIKAIAVILLISKSITLLPDLNIFYLGIVYFQDLIAQLGWAHQIITLIDYLLGFCFIVGAIITIFRLNLGSEFLKWCLIFQLVICVLTFIFNENVYLLHFSNGNVEIIRHASITKGSIFANTLYYGVLLGFLAVCMDRKKKEKVAVDLSRNYDEKEPDH